MKRIWLAIRVWVITFAIVAAIVFLLYYAFLRIIRFPERGKALEAFNTYYSKDDEIRRLNYFSLNEYEMSFYIEDLQVSICLTNNTDLQWPENGMLTVKRFYQNTTGEDTVKILEEYEIIEVSADTLYIDFSGDIKEIPIDVLFFQNINRSKLRIKVAYVDTVSQYSATKVYGYYNKKVAKEYLEHYEKCILSNLVFFDAQDTFDELASADNDFSFFLNKRHYYPNTVLCFQQVDSSLYSITPLMIGELEKGSYIDAYYGIVPEEVGMFFIER